MNEEAVRLYRKADTDMSLETTIREAKSYRKWLSGWIYKLRFSVR